MHIQLPVRTSFIKTIHEIKLSRLLIILCSFVLTFSVKAQCDVEVSGILAYCNSFKGTSNNTIPGFFIGFRIQSNNGDTLNVVDLNGNVPMNLGKRVDDINTQNEPSDTSRAPVMIAGGTDSLEFWYFGPFTNGDSFHIVLIDPSGICDTIEVASGTFTCEGVDPNACDQNVPLYFLDFSMSEWQIGGGGSANENVDAVYLVMQRSRVATCCQTGNDRCFEFIITLDDDDIGLLIDDVGSGATGGHIYADSLNGFACGSSQSDTWPYYQDNGQSSDEPLCLSGSAREWIVLTCKDGNNVTGVSIGTVGAINVLPEYVFADCSVDLEVLNASSATWSSPDDPNLNNLSNFTPNNLDATFLYNVNTFGPVSSCQGDTFTYYVSGYPDNLCLSLTQLYYDTTFVVVYPPFSVAIDSICLVSNDSLLLEAIISGDSLECSYQYTWSTGDTTASIVVPNVQGQYSVSIIRDDLGPLVRDCSPAVDVININPFSISCLPNEVYNCITEQPPANVNLVEASGCGIDPLIYSRDFNNGGTGCLTDSLIITRYYIVDFDGDTINTTDDKDTCVQLFIYIDNVPPGITCPPSVTIGCTSSTLPSATGFASAVDNCDPSPGVAYTDLITPGICPQEYRITRTWIASDQCGNMRTCNQIITIDDNNTPVVQCPANITIQCTDSTMPSSTGWATASDICDPFPVITYTDNVSSGVCPKIITRRWRVTDACGNSKTCDQIITQIDNGAPSIMCPPDITLQCPQSTNPSNTGFATGSDDCDLTLAITFTNVITPGSCPQAFIITRTWRATDDCNNFSTCIQIISVIDTVAPVLSCPPNVSIQCNSGTSPLQAGVGTATDACDMNVAVTYSDEVIEGSCPNSRTITRTWRADDDCGNFSTCVQIISVSDTEAPVISCPVNITLDCSESTLPPNTGIATAIDNCDGTLSPAYIDVIVSGDCPQEYVITRNWTVQDLCGNSSNCSQIITITDLLAPVLVCPADVTILYSASTLPANTGNPMVTDNCDAEPEVVYTDITSPPCANENLIVRTWIATDDCGNSSTCQQNIFIDDRGSICGVVKDDLDQPLGDVQIQLVADINSNSSFDAGDTLVASILTTSGTGVFCFNNLPPCNYLLIEIQPATYGDLLDYDFTPDPDGNDSLDGPDNEIPVVLSPGEADNDNNFINIICPTTLPVIPPDTICAGDSLVFETTALIPGPLTYTWNFGSGSDPLTAMGLGPHTVSYVTTTQNQSSSSVITLTVSKEGCPELSGQVSSVDVNPYPIATINGSTANLCYYLDRVFQPSAPEIPGASYNWTFGPNAVPLTATGYGPHTVYYTVIGTKTVSLVIEPNEAGAQCIDSSSITFNVVTCNGNITGTVKSVSGQGIQGVNIRLYADYNVDGVADNNTSIRSVFTTTNGSYSMVGLTPASYVIVQTQPNGWFSVHDEDTSDDGDLVDNLDPLDNLIPATITPLEVDANNNFIESAIPGSINGAVFVDADNDETLDTGEGIGNVTILLYNDENKDGLPDTIIAVQSAITTSSGTFSFAEVPVGNYVLIEEQPAGYISVKDIDTSEDQDSVPNTNLTDDIIPVTVLNAENDQHNYFINQHECSLIVTNTNDNGEGSLRFMINCAQDSDTIRFDSSLAGQTIMLTSARIEIEKSVTILSDCIPRVTIASEISGMFEIVSGKIVKFDGMDLISGLAGSPGAVFYNFGVLKLGDVTIFSNPLLPPGSIMIWNSMNSQLIIQGNAFINSN